MYDSAYGAIKGTDDLHLIELGNGAYMNVGQALRGMGNVYNTVEQTKENGVMGFVSGMSQAWADGEAFRAQVAAQTDTLSFEQQIESSNGADAYKKESEKAKKKADKAVKAIDSAKIEDSVKDAQTKFSGIATKAKSNIETADKNIAGLQGDLRNLSFSGGSAKEIQAKSDEIVNKAATEAANATSEAQVAESAARDFETAVKNGGKADAAKKPNETAGTEGNNKPEATDGTKKTDKTDATKKPNEIKPSLTGTTYIKNNANIKFYSSINDPALAGKDVVNVQGKGYILNSEHTSKRIITKAEFDALGNDEKAKYQNGQGNSAVSLNIFGAIEGGVNAYNAGEEIVDGIGNIGKTPELDNTSTDINSGLTPEQIEAQEKAKAEAEAEAKRQAEWEKLVSEWSNDSYEWI